MYVLKIMKLSCLDFAAPGLAWDAALKVSKVKLELLSDPDMLPFFEKGIRGGISMISKRYERANNKYMEDFNPESFSKFITHLDANNLYGWVLCNSLPIGNFKWMNKEKIEDWKNIPCVLENDLDYPKELMIYIMISLLLLRDYN